MKKALLTALLIFLVMAPTIAQSWYPKEFKITQRYESEYGSGETVHHIGDEKIFMNRLADGEKTVVTLTDLTGSRPSAIILYPQTKQYLVTYLDEPENRAMWGGTVPVGDRRHPCSTGLWECEMQGTEKLNGRTVDRWEIVTQDEVRTIAWIDRELKFPLRIENENGSTHQLVELNVGFQPNDLFVMPEGYEEMTF